MKKGKIFGILWCIFRLYDLNIGRVGMIHEAGYHRFSPTPFFLSQSTGLMYGFLVYVYESELIFPRNPRVYLYDRLQRGIVLG